MKAVCALVAAHTHRSDDALDPQFAESFFQGPAALQCVSVYDHLFSSQVLILKFSQGV